jgi:hypothetical protein
MASILQMASNGIAKMIAYRSNARSDGMPAYAANPRRCRAEHSYMSVFFSRWLWMITIAMTMLLWALLPASAGQTQSAAADCFPFESLSPPLRARAERLLLNAFDGEALYTIAADIKPISSGILSIEVAIDTHDRREVDELDEIMRTWTCGGEVSGALLRFKAVYDGKRPMNVTVFNHPRLINVITSHADVFSALGISSSSSPLAVFQAVDSADRLLRFRGLGLLFGFPDEAVEFFVAADVPRRRALRLCGAERAE